MGEMMPISLTGCSEGDPGLYILPVEYAQVSASLPPVLVKFWQFFPAASATERPGWKLVTAIGGGA